jgi:hypothetical protein
MKTYGTAAGSFTSSTAKVRVNSSPVFFFLEDISARPYAPTQSHTSYHTIQQILAYTRFHANRQRKEVDANELCMLSGNYTEDQEQPVVPIAPYANINEVSRRPRELQVQ